MQFPRIVNTYNSKRRSLLVPQAFGSRRPYISNSPDAQDEPSFNRTISFQERSGIQWHELSLSHSDANPKSRQSQPKMLQAYKIGQEAIVKRAENKFQADLKKSFKPNDAEIHKIFMEAEVMDEDQYKNLELKCTYCLGLLYNPKQCATCVTPYCEICIMKSISQEDEWSCPKKCGENDFNELNRIVQNMYKQVQVKCLQCQQTMNVEELGSDQHLKNNCMQKTAHCPLGCKQILKSIEQGHEHWNQSCTLAWICCQYCNKALLRENLVSHNKWCEKFPINCPHIGCESQIERSQLKYHIEECEFKTIICKLCGSYQDIQKNIPDHHLSCNKTMIPCETCSIPLQRRHQGFHNCLKVVGSHIENLTNDNIKLKEDQANMQAQLQDQSKMQAQIQDLQVQLERILDQLQK